MTTTRRKGAYVPNPSYTEEDWNEVSDNPPLTDAELAQMRPAGEVLGEAFMASVAMRGRGPQKAPAKRLVSLRLDQDVIEGFRASGPGWQSRMNAVLKKALTGT